MPGATKPSPHPSPTKHTPPPLLPPGTLERGWVGFLHSGIEGGIFHSKENIRNFSPPASSPLTVGFEENIGEDSSAHTARTPPASLTLTLTLACHGHLQTLAPSPATKSWRYRGSCGFAQSTWGRAGSGERGGHGRPGDTLPGGAARSGLTRSRERLGCMGERPEASLVHPSQGGKPGTLGTGVGVREKGCRENTPFPSFLQLSLK